MTWPPQSPNLNPIEMVWDELDRRVRKSSQQVLSIYGNFFKTVGKAFQVKLVERMPRVGKAVIKAKGLQQQGIFRVPGSQVEVNDIKNSFERGEDPLIEDQNEHDINSVAGVLKLYFRGLENPLFPKERFLDLMSTIKLESGAERAHHVQQIVVTLPRTVIIVMRYLFAFLNQ
ncbi:unnamed protein product [Oncorhynchus mykiss]|uniref:Rho-GAP domain-containing protein n=1 Tax=Oncorhynchus mykiss TaxID=8022 RepID=A0A060Z0V0_ONCMY|nr:unnamed protein product [Oncorhynchus mykiss]